MRSVKDNRPSSIWERTPCPASSSASPERTSSSRPARSCPRTPSRHGLTTYLLIDAGGTLQALKAEVRRAGTDGELVATLLDPFRLGQRRTFSRAPLVLPAHLRPLGEPRTRRRPPSPATSAPVACASRASPPTSAADVHEVVIGLVQANREIKATAETVRETDTDVSLSFIEIEAEDRLILAQLTFAYHRRRAGQ